MLDIGRVVTAATVEDARIAPDGALVAYVVGEAAQEHVGTRRSAVWLADADGSEQPRQLTAGCRADWSPRWAPDGRRIAFLSDRQDAGVGQVYLLDLEAGGEAHRLTDHPAGVSELAWSPDGRMLAYVARQAETAQERERREAGDDARVLSQAVRRASLWVLDVPDGSAPGVLAAARQLTPATQHVGAYMVNSFCWLPDGSGLVAVVSAGPRGDDMARPDLVVVDLAGASRSLGVFEGLTFGPVCSPDGSTLAFVAAEGAIPARFVLQTLPLAGGAPRVVLPGYAASFHQVAWLPDGSRLLAQVEQGQRDRLLAIDVASGAVTDAFPEAGRAGTLTWSAAGGGAISTDGTRVAITRGDATAYDDVCVAELGGAARQLSDHNPWVGECALGALREVAWESFDGLRNEGLLILPVGYEPGQRYPLMTQLHGGPAGAWKQQLYASWHDWGQLLAQRGIATFLPNPRGSTGRDTAFLCGITGCYGEPDWQDIMTGVEHLIVEGIADPERLVVGGWSGGGYLTNRTVVQTHRFKAAISGAGPSNWISFLGTTDIRTVFSRYMHPIEEDPELAWRLSPVRLVRQVTTPTLFLHGELDDRVPVTQGYEMYDGLRSRGVRTEMVVYPREPHGILERHHQRDLLERVLAWVDAAVGEG
jgi:dipeptidyl aminopeptidase/acylaminoacyl peptidase